MADDWIRVVELWCWQQPLLQLRKNHFFNQLLQQLIFCNNCLERMKTNKIDPGNAIAHWIRLHLPFCHPGFESQAHHQSFFIYIQNCATFIM